MNDTILEPIGGKPKEGIDVGGIIKRYRVRANLTQTELGELLKVGRSTVARYESGEIMPPSSKLLEMTGIFGEEFHEEVFTGRLKLSFADEDSVANHFLFTLMAENAGFRAVDYVRKEEIDKDTTIMTTSVHVFDEQGSDYYISFKDAYALAERCFEHMAIDFKAFLKGYENGKEKKNDR